MQLELAPDSSSKPTRTIKAPLGSIEWYLEIKRAVADEGYAEEADWAQFLTPVADSHTFWCEYSWVVLNSGMKEQIARQIWQRVRPAVEAGQSASSVFGHKGKSAAIDYVWTNRERLLAEYLAAADKVEWCDTMPFVGSITKWHLAKNYGHDCAKPDRHLVRIAGAEGPHALCERISKATGDRIATVDVVIWRAANLKIIPSASAPTTTPQP